MTRLLAAALLAASPAAAFELQNPVDCEIGRDCFLQQYVDHDDGPDARDLACGPRSYDGHKGTDIRLATTQEISRGVDVLAAAGGIVQGVRDGMEDIASNAPNAPDIAGKECGNGVVVDHENGWSTQYCHLLKGSVTVAPGDRVAGGAVLGEIGLSGQTEFPHLHITLRQGNTVVDPFTGAAMGSACGSGGGSLWAAESGITYTPGGLMSAGVTDRVPDYAEVKDSAPHSDRYPADVPALVMWGHFFGLEKGDRLETRLLAPSGAVVAEATHVMDRPRATEFRAVGRRIPQRGWPAGTYRGISRLIRGEKTVAEMERVAEIR
ncbi:MAG: M23 family metallopeptidase [Pseudomonadota bacterium]